MKTINIPKQELVLWKRVKGYEALYLVSTKGEVKSLRKNKKLKLLNMSNGYLKVCLYKDNKMSNILVHRLVAEAFIPNPENKPLVDHINTNRKDNNVKNLRWVTNKENSNNPLSIENNRKAQSGENHPFYGKHRGEHFSQIMSKRMSGEGNPCYGKFGADNPGFKGYIYCPQLDMQFEGCMDAERKCQDMGLKVTHQGISHNLSGKYKSHGYFVNEYGDRIKLTWERLE